jgi:RNA polymerase sigma-70 factor (ECF subfamily)
MLSHEERTRLEQWAREVLPRALAYARSLLRDPIRSEDVVQECLLRLLRHAGTYDLPRDGVKILFKAISRLCLNETTRRRAMVSLSLDLPVADNRFPSPEEVLIGRELQEEIAEGLAQLPELQRAALELRALGQSKEEIAEILEVTSSHAGVLVHRARQGLAAHLARNRGIVESEGVSSGAIER